MSSHKTYNYNFYKSRYDQTIYYVGVIIDEYLKYRDFPQSVIDVGCGVGVWLEEFKNRGAEKVKGSD